jgi:hypothetical protein
MGSPPPTVGTLLKQPQARMASGSLQPGWMCAGRSLAAYPMELYWLQS